MGLFDKEGAQAAGDGADQVVELGGDVLDSAVMPIQMPLSPKRCHRLIAVPVNTATGRVPQDGGLNQP